MPTSSAHRVAPLSLSILALVLGALGALGALGCSGDPGGPSSPPVTPPVGTPPVVTPPVTPPPPAPFASGHTLVAGVENNCVLGTGGAAFCRGGGGHGALGNASAADTASLVPVGEEQRYVALAMNAPNSTVGPYTVCGLTASGEAWCWGSSPDGLIGSGPPCAAMVDPSQPVTCWYGPQSVTPALRFRRIAIGRAHICGVTADSSAVCWGRNREGQLGTGSASTIATTTPAPVAGGLRLVDIAAGDYGTCGVDAQGTGWCWGDNQSGQVGDSTRTPRASPSRVRFAGRFRTIQVGTQTSCGLTTDGAVYCWGRTSRRAAGVVGPFADSVTTTPVRVPLPVPTPSLGYGLATGCAVGTDGVARCWGLNTQGGAGPRTSPQCVNSPFGEALCFPNPVATPPLTQVSVGALHTCGRATDGLVWCWGWNHRTQVGPRGSASEIPQSIQVP